mmetsp:Transcript_9306/g.34426  ORF Transcript_9306/g.34426 Transcript_9306/m.34426 type:complete len:202 (-) Transcript_9306:2476-3081(-)
MCWHTQRSESLVCLPRQLVVLEHGGKFCQCGHNEGAIHAIWCLFAHVHEKESGHVEQILWWHGVEWQLGVFVNVMIGVVEGAQLFASVEYLHTLPHLNLLSIGEGVSSILHVVLVHLEVLECQQKEVVGSILEATLQNSVVAQELNHLDGLLWFSCVNEGSHGLVKLVILSQVARIRDVHLLFELRMLFEKCKGVLPILGP